MLRKTIKNPSWQNLWKYIFIAIYNFAFLFFELLQLWCYGQCFLKHFWWLRIILHFSRVLFFYLDPSHLKVDQSYLFTFIFSRVHATLWPTLWVGPSVRRSVRRSVTLSFFSWFYVILSHFKLFYFISSQFKSF